MVGNRIVTIVTMEEGAGAGREEEEEVDGKNCVTERERCEEKQEEAR